MYSIRVLVTKNECDFIVFLKHHYIRNFIILYSGIYTTVMAEKRTYTAYYHQYSVWN